MTGALAHPLGAAATPSITFTGDTNTGIYSPGADQVAISTNGTGRLFVDASGRLGVGTSSPAVNLHIRATGTPILRIQDDDGTGQYSDFYNSAGQSVYNAVNGAGVSGAHIFLQAGNESARIDTTGRLGLGTSNPASSLHIAGANPQVRVQDTDGTNQTGIFYKNGGATIFYSQDGTSNGSFQWIQNNGTTSTTSLVLNSAGQLGLGNSNPANAKLLIGTDLGALTTADRMIQVGHSAGGMIALGKDNTDYSYLMHDASTQKSHWMYRGALGLTLDSSGRVGIGTTSPGGKLAVSDGTAYFQFDPVGGTANILRSLTGAGSREALQLDATQLVFANSGSERFRCDSSGRFLVGTSSASANGTLFLQGTNAGATNGGTIRMAAGTTSPANGAELGIIAFSDSSHSQAAFMLAKRDGGTWTSGSSMPSRLEFSTCSDGSASPSERFRIAQNGAWGLAGANYGSSGQVLTSNGSGSAPTWAAPPGIGVGQTWTNVTASRAVGTTYTNSTSLPITVVIAFAFPSAGGTGVLTVAGVAIQFGQVNSAYIQLASGTAIVPAGATYVFSGSVTINQWLELR
jgi:hypothetical protein